MEEPLGVGKGNFVWVFVNCLFIQLVRVVYLASGAGRTIDPILEFVLVFPLCSDAATVKMKLKPFHSEAVRQ